jgi:alanine racemase
LEKHLTWAEIDLNAYAHNIRELRRITSPNARLMAVVKADGYGHGALEVARVALLNGADWLGVARLHEAVELREKGVEAPILVLGYTPPDAAQTLIEFDLSQSVYSRDTAEAYSGQAAGAGKSLKVHIKVDSGMGRLGIVLDDLLDDDADPAITGSALNEVEAISRLDNLNVEGLFTHFATSDSADKSYADQQLKRFSGFIAKLDRAGLTPAVKHAANSGAVIDMPASHLDLVRPGIATYGLNPSDEVNLSKVNLKPVMALKSRIIHLKKVPAGFHISYGITYRTPNPTTIATVPVGYADGLNRLLSSRGHMLAGGRRVPIVGRVCMDLTMLDVGMVDSVRIEDEVVIFGEQGKNTITADELAAELNTINYEIVTSITSRVPRVYLE